MQNLQNVQNLSSFSRKFGGSVTLQDYIKSLSGLVAYYPLDETSGNAINRAPATLGSFDGTLTSVTQGVAGQSGNAYTFDGSTSTINLGNASSSNSLKPALPITIGFFMKFSANPATIDRFIIGLDQWTATAYAGVNVSLTTAGAIGAGLGNGAGSGSTNRRNFIATTALSTNTWYFITGVFNSASDIDIFYNELEKATTNSGTAAAIGYTTAPSRIGSSEDGVRIGYFPGTIQHAFVLNRAMTQQERENILTQASFFF